MRQAVSRQGRHAHARPAYAVVFPRPSHVQEVNRARRAHRVRVRAVRAPAVVSGRRRSLSRIGRLQQEGPLSVRPVRPRRAPRSAIATAIANSRATAATHFSRPSATSRTSHIRRSAWSAGTGFSTWRAEADIWSTCAAIAATRSASRSLRRIARRSRRSSRQCVLFFWMFLAADPFERAGAVAYAALWRHGMAGNSPLYMPGFFAVAAAAWWWSHATRLPRLWLEGSIVVVAACAVATALAPWPSLRAVVHATYTLATWTVCVVCCRRALARRAWRPLWPVPLLTAGLMALRTWTLDDVQTLWIERLLNGDAVAVVSSAALPALVIVMLRTELTSSTRRGAVPAPYEPGGRHKSGPPLSSEQSP